MGRKGIRYTLEEKLFYIGLVQAGSTTREIERQYGVKHGQVKVWLERYQFKGVDGLKRAPGIRQYSKEFKLGVVQEYLSGGTSYPKLARKYEVSNIGVIYQWVSRYTSGKSLDSTRRRTPLNEGRKTTKLERIEIAEWTIAHEKHYTEAANHFNVSYGQVYSWVKKYEKDGADGLADRRGKAKEDNGHLSELEKKDLEIKRLKARLEYVSTEAAILKKLQEIERMDAHKKNIKPFKHSPKK
jgi:transposase